MNLRDKGFPIKGQCGLHLGACQGRALLLGYESIDPDFECWRWHHHADGVIYQCQTREWIVDRVVRQMCREWGKESSKYGRVLRVDLRQEPRNRASAKRHLNAMNFSSVTRKEHKTSFPTAFITPTTSIHHLTFSDSSYYILWPANYWSILPRSGFSEAKATFSYSKTHT